MSKRTKPRLNRAERRARLKAYQNHLERRKYHFEHTLTEADKSAWPTGHARPPVRVLVSKRFMCMVFDYEGHTRLSVHRMEVAALNDEGGPVWADGITWDELMRVKAEAGYADRWAVEVYPPDAEAVTACNLRHLWLLDEKPPYAW